jgi:hypothetical protein
MPDLFSIHPQGMGRHGFPNWGKFSMTARVAPVALRVSCDRACLWRALPKGLLVME